MAERYLEDYAVGQTFRSGSVRVTAEEIIRFAGQFDPQPFHLDDAAARGTIFRGLAASGWHTAALTMKLLVTSDVVPINGIIGVGFDELRWPRPVRPNDQLHVDSEVLDVRASKSNPRQGILKLRSTTLNGDGEQVQISIGNIIVARRDS